MKIDDEYIIKIFYINNGLGPLNSQMRYKFENYSKIVFSLNLDKAILIYLHKRFNDSKSLHETLFRIKNHIEKRPHCITPGCTNEVAFNGTVKKPYALHCCCSCTQKDKNVRDKQKNSCLRLYGVENGAQSQQAKLKYQNHMEDKYGSGIKNAWQAKEVKDKCKQKILDKFGVDNIAKSQYSKDKHKACEKQTVEKRNTTKRIRGTFNTSKPEEMCYRLLVDKFGLDNVIRQYTSDLYPFNCDFYIKSRDLYIEYNGSWTHGKHPFDPMNENDIALLEKWKAKGKKYYFVAINTWTKRDVIKRSIAKQNGICIKEFWKISELEEFLKDLP